MTPGYTGCTSRNDLPDELLEEIICVIALDILAEEREPPWPSPSRARNLWSLSLVSRRFHRLSLDSLHHRFCYEHERIKPSCTIDQAIKLRSRFVTKNGHQEEAVPPVKLSSAKKIHIF